MPKTTSNKKRAAEALQEKSETILQLKSDVREIEEMAMEVALEQHETARQSSKLVKESKRRLETVQRSKSDISTLQDSLDSVRENYTEEMEKACSEISILKTQLNELEIKLERSEEYADGLEDKLIEAQEVINVSYITFISNSFYLLLVKV